jgi:hypothetical protein
MTPEQKHTFDTQGFLYLPAALPQAAVLPVKTHVLNALKKQKIWSSGRVLSNRLKDVPLFQQVGKINQMIPPYSGLKEQLVPQPVSALMSHLTGSPLTAAPDSQLLISLPHSTDWSLEGLNWHRDIGALKPNHMPGIQVFVLLDQLVPHGGATLALTGSHCFKTPVQTKQVINRLGADHKGVWDGTEISLLEMVGQAGDIYLMDMRLLHTPSINASRNLRMMATVRYFLRR